MPRPSSSPSRPRSGSSPGRKGSSGTTQPCGAGARTGACPTSATTRALAGSGEEGRLERFHEVPAAGVPEDAGHVRLLRDLAGTEVVGVTYATEMAYYAQHNPRCVVFGPGETERIHVPDERVSLQETGRAAESLAEFGTRPAAGPKL